MNNSFLGGRVDSEVETHEVGNNRIVANFIMSTKHRDKVDYHRIVAWDEAAKIAALLRKGDPVFIEGRIQTRSIGEGEQRRREVEIVAWTIYPIKGRVEMEDRVSNG